MLKSSVFKNQQAQITSNYHILYHLLGVLTMYYPFERSACWQIFTQVVVSTKMGSANYPLWAVTVLRRKRFSVGKSWEAMGFPRKLWKVRSNVHKTQVVVSNMFLFLPLLGRFPFWLIFFNWVETTNQKTINHGVAAAFDLPWGSLRFELRVKNLVSWRVYWKGFAVWHQWYDDG